MPLSLWPGDVSLFLQLLQRLRRLTHCGLCRSLPKHNSGAVLGSTSEAFLKGKTQGVPKQARYSHSFYANGNPHTSTYCIPRSFCPEFDANVWLAENFGRSSCVWEKEWWQKVASNWIPLLTLLGGLFRFVSVRQRALCDKGGLLSFTSTLGRGELHGSRPVGSPDEGRASLLAQVTCSKSQEEVKTTGFHQRASLIDAIWSHLSPFLVCFGLPRSTALAPMSGYSNQRCPSCAVETPTKSPWRQTPLSSCYSTLFKAPAHDWQHVQYIWVVYAEY